MYILEGLCFRWILKVLVLRDVDVGLFGVLIWIYRVIKTWPRPPPAQHWRLRDENEDNKGHSSMHATWPLVTTENITTILCYKYSLCRYKFIVSETKNSSFSSGKLHKNGPQFLLMTMKWSLNKWCVIWNGLEDEYE